MMHLSQYDVAAVKHVALARCATAVGIDYAEFFDPDSLKFFIDHKHETLWNLWKAFADAYQAWFDYHVEIHKAGKQDNLSADETRHLDSLVRSRNSTRKELIEVVEHAESN